MSAPRVMGCWVVVAWLLGPVPNALAGGFAISETGARYSGRANAVTAVADSSISVLYNPANLTRLTGFNGELGLSLIFPRFEYTAETADGSPVKSTVSVVTPPMGTASYTVDDFFGIGTFAAGVGISVPYGSSFGWPDNWEHNQALQQMAMMAFEISPVVAIRPHPMIAIGGGLRVIPTQIYLKRAVGFGDQAEGEVALAGRGTALGGSASLSFWPTSDLAFGVTWRSAATLKAEGDSDFSFPAPFDTMAVDRDIRGTLPLPEVYRVGADWNLIPGQIDLSVDLEYQLWSRYRELAITFLNPDGTTEVMADEKQSKNSWVFHLGGEYQLNDEWAVRAGYAWDQKTLPESTVGPAPPDSDRHVVAVGASYDLGRMAIHAHFANLFFVPRKTLSNRYRGTWRGGYPASTTAYLCSLGVSVALDSPQSPDLPTSAPEESPSSDRAPSPSVPDRRSDTAPSPETSGSSPDPTEIPLESVIKPPPTEPPRPSIQPVVPIERLDLEEGHAP